MQLYKEFACADMDRLEFLRVFTYFMSLVGTACLAGAGDDFLVSRAASSAAGNEVLGEFGRRRALRPDGRGINGGGNANAGLTIPCFRDIKNIGPIDECFARA